MIDISAIVAAWGRQGLYERHLIAIGKASVGLRVGYSVGTIEPDATAKCRSLLRHAEFAAATEVSAVKTQRAWPLPLAYNAALAAASADIVVIVGAEVLIPLGLLHNAMSVPEGVARQYTTCDTGGAQYIGPTRRLAFPYCMAIRRKHLVAVGGWDEAFADGIGFDDNDLAARLIISGIRFEWCDEYECTHQAHGPYHGESQHERGIINQTIWRERLNGYIGSLWPIALGPEGDCNAQGRLAEALSSRGYLQKYTSDAKKDKQSA